MSAKKKAGKAAGRKITPKPPGPRVPDEIKTKRDSKGHVVVTKETVHPTSGKTKPQPKKGESGTGSVGTGGPTKRKKKTTTKKRPVIKVGDPSAPTKMSTKEKVQIGATGSLLGAIGVGSMLNRSKKIRAGDTLSQIAKRNKMSLKQLLKMNPNIKDPNKIRIGQTITLPGALGRALGIKGKKTKNPYEGMTKSEMAKMAMPKKKKGGGKIVYRKGGGPALVASQYNNKI